MFVMKIGYSQTTFDWMDTAPDGNWRQGNSGARWFGGSCGSGCFDEPGYGILRFNNNHQLNMTNNVPGTYGIHQIIFGSSNTSNRSIGNLGANIVRFFDNSGADPKIENQSSGNHTISFNILGDGDSGDPLEINPVSGNLTFNNTIGNQGSPIDIYGNNGFTVRFNNIISGAGAFRIRQNSKVIFNDINTYTGNTELDNGELWIETTGDAVANNNIFLGNGDQLGNTAKIFLSRATGGTTFSRTININPGNANTRFIGSLNSSGTNTFSGNILRSSTQPLNVEVLNSGGSLNVSGVINGTSAITKVGAGTLILSGTNTYTGGTVISAGTVSASTAANLGATGGAITLGNGTTTGTLNITASLARTQVRVTDASSAGVINVASGQTFTLTNLNMVSGTNNTTKIGKSGSGTLTLSGAGTYVGQTQVGEGVVIVSNDSGLGTNNSTTARGIDLGLNVGDVSQANNVSVFATTGITIPQSIYVAPNTSGATRTIGLSGASGSTTFNNEIFLDGTLTVAGTGTVTLSGRLINTGGLISTATTTILSNATSNFTGTTTVQSGSELRLNPSVNATYASQIILNGGTLATTSITTNSTFTSSSTLRLDASSTIALGTNAHTLTFANSSAVTWTGSTLTITGWTGTPGITGTASAGRIFIGAANTTLTSAQLDQITFQGYEPGAVLKTTGELMPKGYITYYSKGSLAPDVLTNWSLTTDGTGASPSNFTSTARFVIQNGHTMTTSAAWTLTGASTTLQILNGGALVSSFAVTMPSSGVFQIDNGGLYKHDNISAWGSTIFSGTEVFGNSSTVEINRTNTNLPTNSSYGNLTIDLSVDPTAALSFAGNLTAVNGNLIIKHTRGRQVLLAASSGPTITVVGNLEVHPNADFAIVTGTANTTLNVDGNINLLGGTFSLATSTGVGFLVARGSSVTVSENVTFAGLLPGASGFYFNRNVEQTLTIAHPFSSGNIRNRFFVSTVNSNVINEVYNGVAAQTTIDGTGVVPGAGWSAWPTATGGTALKSFTINNSAGVTLSTNRFVNTTLGLTSGTITPGANSLTLAAGANFTGGSASSHVNGVLNRVYTSTTTATFPVGKSGIYRPVTFEYTALTGTSTVSINQIESALTGTLPADTYLNNSRTWDISQVGGSSIGYKVTLDPTGDNVSGTVVMLKRESGSTTSHATTSPNFTNTSAFTTLTGVNNFTLGSTCTVTSNAGTNQTDCLGTIFTLAANAPSFGTGAWTVSGPSTNVSQFSNVASPTATFTPDGGSGVYTLTWTITNGNCSSNSSVGITVTNPTIPTFNAVNPICIGDSLSALPTTSNNGIVGTWSPALDNTQTTAYTFTPNAGQCATTASLTITVNSLVTPTFNAVNPICVGDSLSALPTTSINGIVGTWAPALDNTQTTTYTFTPNAGQCATTASLTITVNSLVTPTFSPVAPICQGAPLAALPTTSTNGITGAWSPALDNTQTTTYTFTPDAGQCASTTTLTITVGGTTTWNGTAWSNGAPDALTTAVIAGNYTATANLDACSLVVNNNAVVVIPTGFNVHLSGALTVASGSTFTLNSNANLLQDDASAVNSGNIIVRRATNPLIRLDYVMWSSPVAAQILQPFSPLTSVSPTVRFYTYNTATNLFANVADFATHPMVLGRGYLIRLPFNHPTAPATWTGIFTGVPNNGTQNITMANVAPGQRYNLVGNPYPSTLSMTDFYSNNSNAIEPTVYFWRKTNGTQNPTYCTYNLSTDTYTDNGQPFTEDPNGVIQVGQGFIVEAKDAATTLTFNNGQRIANNANQTFRTAASTQSIERHRVWLNLTGAAGEFSQMMVGYFTDGTLGLDGTDSKYFNDGTTELTSPVNGVACVMNGRPVPFDAADVVPLTYKVATAGTFSVAIDRKDGLFASTTQPIYVHDLTTGTYHNLNDGPYTFTTAVGTFANRLELVYQNALSTENPTLNANTFTVVKNPTQVQVAATESIDTVRVYDLRGRLIVQQTKVNATQVSLPVVGNQVYLVQVTTTSGLTGVKKVL
jgi:autotransporter-associated beta strand protein